MIRYQIWSAAAAIAVASLALATQQAPAALDFDEWFLETEAGRTPLPESLTAGLGAASVNVDRSATLADGRALRLVARIAAGRTTIELTAEPSTGIRRWGTSIGAVADEYFTGIMERVVDGPQQATWAAGRTEALDLRGQTIEMIVKPTLSVYAPFYVSSRAYGFEVRGTWPGIFDFAKADPSRVQIAFEGPSFAFTVYRGDSAAAVVRAHALAAGPPVLPPKWAFSPWRWRDEHTQRAAYYDGTPVTGPFNSEVMEDVLMLKAFGIPIGVYWIDRPWGPGRLGYDDFEIDPGRLPNFRQMVRWLNGQQVKTLLWIAPFFQGKMADEATARGYTLPGQLRPANGNNFPMVDLTNPSAKEYWQKGIEKLLDLGVTAFKLDRGEENIPDEGEPRVHDGRSLREQRNDYVVMYVRAVAEIVRRHRGDDFLVMPRGAYTGSARYGAFWGGDMAATEGGLRASIIGLQRAAVMGYPVWGSDTCGYNQQQLGTQEVCARWLAFSSVSPIMEVGPTRNVGFWNLPTPPAYDETLIALWRTYARLHQRLVEYSHAQARVAHETGEPIVRPVVFVDPGSRDARENWWTYMYGPDLVVSPVWKTGQREQQIYLPRGSRWRDVWRPGAVHDGGRTITVPAPLHQLPMFVRDGARLPIGDLEKEHTESLAIAKVRPDLKTLDAQVAVWFSRNK